MSGSKKKDDARASRRLEHTPEQSIKDALGVESDRGCVLVGASFLEFRLRRLLVCWFWRQPKANQTLIRRVLNPEDPRSLLFSGWAKCVIARLVGVIDQEHYEIIDAIRELRNRFAHRPGQVPLDDTLMSPLVQRLGRRDAKRIEREVQNYVDGKRDKYSWTNAAGTPDFTPARLRFMCVCADVYRYLINCENQVFGDFFIKKSHAVLDFLEGRTSEIDLPAFPGPSIDQA